MMSCCKDEILASIIRQLIAGSPCESEIPDIIPVFWDLVCVESAGNCHLQALLTKREAILFLMGCEAYNVDTAESHYTLAASTVSDSISDFRSQAQSTGSSNRFQKGHGETRYDEKSYAQKDMQSKRTGRANEKSDGDSFYRDDGKGYGFNKSSSFNFIENRTNHQASSKLEGNGDGTGFRRDCNYEYSRNQTTGQSIGIPLIVITFGAGFTGSASEWRKYSQTIGNSFEEYVSEFNGTATERDTALSTSRGRHDWESAFTADIEWFEKEYIIRTHNERFDTKTDQFAHADGNGDGMNEERVESHNSSQGTAQAIGKSNTLRTHSRVSNKSAFALANSQRFGNLLRLYDQLNEQVNHLRKRLRQMSPPLIDIIPCNCNGTCCCLPIMRSRGLNAINSIAETCVNSSDVLWNTRIM